MSTDDHRHRLINDGDVPDVKRVVGDLTVQQDVVDAAAGATHIVHLAALQVPFCRANPAQGAAVNVTGTVNVFEAAKRHGVTQISQASSIAVYGTSTDYDDRIIPSDAQRLPTTLYGVYKVATEDLAAVYWAEHEVRSVCLRPHTVFGPGRDQGMTSLPSIAIEKAVRREPFHIDFGGSLDFQLASDVAASFIHAMRVDPRRCPHVQSRRIVHNGCRVRRNHHVDHRIRGDHLRRSSPTRDRGCRRDRLVARRRPHTHTSP